MDAHHLFAILYASVATQPPSADDLAVLVQRARSYNAARDLTGQLTYIGQSEIHQPRTGSFVQWLEGPEEAVSEVFYGRIFHDPSHIVERIEYFGPIRARLFPDWTMALRREDFNPAAVTLELARLLGKAEAHSVVPS